MARAIPLTSLRRSLPKPVARRRTGWIFIIPSLVMIVLFALPLLALILRAAGSDFLISIAAPSALQALRVSLVTSTLSLCVTLLCGTPLAYLLARSQFPLKPWLETLIDLPIVLPPSVAGIALLMAFGRNGMVGPSLSLLGIHLPFTTAAVVMAQTFVSGPLYIRAARIGFTDVDVQLEEAATVEGANAWQLFREVMIPLAGTALLNGAILCWARALGEFGATILFAGNLEGVTQTMPLAVYIGLERDLAIALALSVMLVAVSILLLTSARRLERRED
ncbi:MAG TPA: ABC transporter permease [Anaerolineales bacterium]|nr:ABC transporter permease [Anaerolineales bacterium]